MKRTSPRTPTNRTLNRTRESTLVRSSAASAKEEVELLDAISEKMRGDPRFFSRLPVLPKTYNQNLRVLTIGHRCVVIKLCSWEHPYDEQTAERHGADPRAYREFFQKYKGLIDRGKMRKPTSYELVQIKIFGEPIRAQQEIDGIVRNHVFLVMEHARRNLRTTIENQSFKDAWLALNADLVRLRERHSLLAPQPMPFPLGRNGNAWRLGLNPDWG